jgi:hypothetical protein
MPHAQIKTKQAKLTLLQLHAELAGKILDNKREADRLREAIGHVEAVIKMLDPTHNLRTIAIRRRKPNEWFKRGTVWRAALDAMRRAGGPLTISEIAARMLDTKHIDDAPRSAVAKLEAAVRASLHKNDGKTVEKAGPERPYQWKLATQ